MTLQVLIPTMNKKKEDIFPLLDLLNIQSDCVIGNQCDEDDDYSLEYKGHNVFVHCSKERGVSRNRNVIIALATADIVLYLDDDCPLIDNYPEIVLKSFENKAKPEVILFSRISENEQFDSVKFKTKKVRRFHEISTIGGPGIAIDRVAFQKYGIKWNEKLGAPNYICLGEDSVFGMDLIKKKVIFWTSAIPLFTILPLECACSCYKKYDKRFFESLGSVTKILHRRLWVVFFIKKSFYWAGKTGMEFYMIYKMLNRKTLEEKSYEDKLLD